MSWIGRIVDGLEEVFKGASDRLKEKIHKLPLYELGLRNIPAVPLALDGLVKALITQNKRSAQTQQATHGLSNVFTISGETRPAHAFLWGDHDEDKAEHRGDVSGPARSKLNEMLDGGPVSVGKHLVDRLNEKGPDLIEKSTPQKLTTLSLETPEQFAMSWTTFPDVYGDSNHLLSKFSDSLSDPEVASREFWPTISEYGLPFNLLLAEKVSAERGTDVSTVFGSAWSQEFADLQSAGQLYLIDLGIFAGFEPQEVDDGVRFTPATLTLLRQDVARKALEPIAVRVSGKDDRGARVYVRGVASDSAWLYALQAAKASVGVYGIWLGHVYHWHIPTAAMQMTMFNSLPEEHVLLQLLQPQSRHLIEFDSLLLLLWENIAPPTSITSARQFVELENTFAEGRTFFDDDPLAILERCGISEADFSHEQPWDKYRTAGYLLRIWEITGDYVNTVVDALYSTDMEVVQDEDLQRWMRESADPGEGNIRGLPEMNSRRALRSVLHSYLYRITAHGSSRLPNAANPGLTFVANFPPCLQSSVIPEPEAELSSKEILEYLPNTGTIGKYISFFFVFSFSVPLEPMVPIDGVGEDLFFGGETPSEKACNNALVDFRRAIVSFIGDYQDGTPQVAQWPRNIEL